MKLENINLETKEGQLLWAALIEFTTKVHKDKTPHEVIDMLELIWQNCKPDEISN